MNAIDPQQLRLAADILEQRQAGKEPKWEYYHSPMWSAVGSFTFDPVDLLQKGHSIRLTPWQLPLAPEGRSWYRASEFTRKDMLPYPDSRPLMEGEIIMLGDEYTYSGGEWRPHTSCRGDLCGLTTTHCISRTRRPAVPPKPQVRAWNRESLPELPFEIRHKETGNRYAVTSGEEAGTFVAAYGAGSYESLLLNFTLRDGSPCGTTEEAP